MGRLFLPGERPRTAPVNRPPRSPNPLIGTGSWSTVRPLLIGGSAPMPGAGRGPYGLPGAADRRHVTQHPQWRKSRMDASPTLQDFVLDLLYRPEARTAFEADPQAALQQAGLGDISPVDVQQVLPLVVDYAPVSGVTGLTGVDDLSHGVANLDVAGAVAHLQTITALTPV